MPISLSTTFLPGFDLSQLRVQEFVSERRHHPCGLISTVLVPSILPLISGEANSLSMPNGRLRDKASAVGLDRWRGFSVAPVSCRQPLSQIVGYASFEEPS